MLSTSVTALLVCAAAASNEAGKAYLAQNAEDAGVVTRPSGLQYKVITSGSPGGKSPLVNSPCVCHYTGSLIDGTVFDSSVQRGKPLGTKPSS